MRNEVVNRQVTRQVFINKFGNIRAALVATKSSSTPNTSGYQLERSCADFMPRRGNTNDARRAPSYKRIDSVTRLLVQDASRSLPR